MSIIQGSSVSASSTESDGFYDFPIEQSLRFDGSSYLSRTFGIPSSDTTRSFSVWVKRDSTSSNNVSIFGSSGSGFEESHIEFQNDALAVNERNSSDGTTDLIENSGVLFRDLSAWYHIVVSIDTRTAVSAENKVKIYINGNLFGSASITPVDNYSVQLFRSSATGYIADNTAGRTLFSGYLANIHFIDGQALNAHYFGELKNGVWIPKAFDGTASDSNYTISGATSSYGTNGFHLTFNPNTVDTGTTPNRFLDQSPNSNHWDIY